MSKEDLYKSVLPCIPNNLEFRQKRYKLSLEGKGHIIYDMNSKLCGNHNYYQYSSGSIETPNGNEKLSPNVILCKDPKEASYLLKNNVSKSDFPYKDIFVGEGILGQTDSKLWKKQREILKPVFKSKVVASLIPLIHYHIQDKNLINHNCLIAQIRNNLLKSPKINIHEYLKNITFIIIGNVALGESSSWLEKNGNKLREAFEISLQPMISQTEYGMNAYQVMGEFANHAWDLSKKRREKNPKAPITIVDTIFKTDYSKLGNNINNDKHKVSELMTIMFAGHETTANTLTWCIYELSKNSEYQERIRQEIFDTMKNNQLFHPSSFNFELIGRMKLVNSAIRETMRLWPVVANGSFRTINQENMYVKGPINKVLLPIGTKFQAPHWLFHRNKLVWGEDADIFNLDRYEQKWNHSSFMPFSKAPRDCIGRHFAMASMRIILIHLLYNFNFKINNNIEKKGYNWATLQPENGLEIIIEDIIFENYIPPLSKL